MLTKVRLLWHSHRLATLAFVAALGLTLFFAIRMVVFAVYWSDPEHRNQTPEAWMTPRYIAHSWGLEVETVGAAIGIDTPPGTRPTLAEIAKNRGVPLQVVLDEVTALLAKMARE